jgi:hypothetical protein
MSEKDSENSLAVATETDAELFREIIGPGDIAYTHALFLQCFLPLRHTTANAKKWQCGNGRLAMQITAGSTVDPKRPGKFNDCETPAGPMGRMIVNYAIDYMYRKETPVIDLGRNLRTAMEQMQVPIAGTSGKALTREVLNFANADIIFGFWTPDGNAHQNKAAVSKSLSFWINKDERQRTIWQPEMIASDEFYRSITDGGHIAPVYLPAYVKLRRSPRAQDVFAWLSYRLRNPLKRPAIIPAAALHSIFGQDTKQFDHFWPEFKTAVRLAHTQYPEARIKFLNDAMVLESSPPRVPYKKLHRITGATPETRREPAKALPAPKPATTTANRLPLTTEQIEGLQSEFPSADIEGLFSNQFWPWLVKTTTDPSKNTFQRYRGWLKKKLEREGYRLPV